MLLSKDLNSFNFSYFFLVLVAHYPSNHQSSNMQIVSMGRKKFSADFQLMFRLLKLFLFIGSVVTLVILFTFLNLTVGDIFASLLAFMPTGWAFLQVHLSLMLYCFFLCISFPSLHFLSESFAALHAPLMYNVF